jgi:hypothetical protein
MIRHDFVEVLGTPQQLASCVPDLRPSVGTGPSLMTTTLSAFLVSNAASLVAISAALAMLGLVGLALFTTEAGEEQLPYGDEARPIARHRLAQTKFGLVGSMAALLVGLALFLGVSSLWDQRQRSTFVKKLSPASGGTFKRSRATQGTGAFRQLRQSREQHPEAVFPVAAPRSSSCIQGGWGRMETSRVTGQLSPSSLPASPAGFLFGDEQEQSGRHGYLGIMKQPMLPDWLVVAFTLLAIIAMSFLVALLTDSVG